MAKRHSVSKGHSKRLFTHTAKYVHPKNGLNLAPARGGIRL